MTSSDELYGLAVSHLAEATQQYMDFSDLVHADGEPSDRDLGTVHYLQHKCIGMEGLIAKVFGRDHTEINRDTLNLIYQGRAAQPSQA